jgi:hypothetical protein
MTERSEGIKTTQQARSFIEPANAFCEAAK